MTALQGSVGRGGQNLPADVRVVQQLLNRQNPPPSPLLGVDGIVGPKTIAAIESFQRRVVGMSLPDGRIDPSGRTWTHLIGANGSSGSVNIKAGGGNPTGGNTTSVKLNVTQLPTPKGAAKLTEADLERAAKELNCELACIKAVAEVEARGDGFFASGRPKILFEAHIFSKETKHKYDATHPDISSAKWNRALYKGGEKEYDRLQAAMALDRTAALKSASWGRFQIMGFNYQACGYSSVEAFVNAMYESEGKHLDAFVAFLKHSKLDKPLREKRWADFAKGYNGPGYAQNQYDVKMKAAYEKYAKAAKP
jgi:hypothetical protein